MVSAGLGVHFECLWVIFVAKRPSVAELGVVMHPCEPECEYSRAERLFLTFNYWTYFTYLFRSYWNKRATLQLNHCMCCFKRFHLRRFLLLLLKENQYVWKNLTWYHFWLCLCLTSLLNMVLKLLMYQFYHTYTSKN